MKYNLIRNAHFDSPTASGAGNVDLSWSQLESLMDGVTTSGGVNLTPGNVLWLSVDMSQRIKLDSIRLYTNDLSKSTNVSFYCKDSETDSYTLLVTNSGIDYYYPTLIDPKAPQLILTTISGVTMGIYELSALNDDYIVAFGTDGLMYAEHLDNIPIGEEGSPQAVAIYNNDIGTVPATGYTTIDYTDTEADNYIKISASENGTYKGFADGVILENNNFASTYIWNMGDYSNVSVDGNKLKITGTGTSISLKLGHLPNGTADEAFRTGANTWDWDRVNKKMYVMGLEGTTLSLWDYEYTTDTWNYLTNLAPAVAANDRFAVMCHCNGEIYVISQFTGTFGKYTISGAINNWTNLPNPTFSYTLNYQDRVSMCSDGVRYIYALTSDYGQSTGNRNFKRFDTVLGTWSSMNTGYQQFNYYSGGHGGYTNTSCLTYDYDKDRVYLINASEEWAQGSNHYIQLYNVSANSWGTNWFNVMTVYNTEYVIESIWYHNKWLYVSCNPNFTTGYFFRYNLDTLEVEKLNLGYVHYNPTSTDVVGVYMIAIDDDSDFGAAVYFAQISADRKYLYGYNTAYRKISSGTYTSSIFKIDDAYSSSYFVVDTTITSGVTSVSYDAGSYNGTIRVKSSNIEPLVIEEIYFPYGRDARKMIPYNGSDTRWLDDYATDSTDAIIGAVDRRTGNVVFLTQHYSRSVNWYKISRSGVTLYSKTLWNDNKYMSDHQIEFDYIGGIWGYGKHHLYYDSGCRLVHLNTTLATELALIHESGNDFLHDFAVEMNGDGVWYTNKSLNLVYHLNTDGNTLQQIVLQTPRAICGTSDNGCWVMDNTDLKVYRYAFNGNLVKTITLTRYIDRMTSDLLDGFWYMRDNTIYHVTSEGVEDTSTMVSQPTMVRAMHTGCVVWSRTTNIITCIDFNGNITRTFTRSSNTYGFGVYAHNYTDHLNYHTTILPISYDPVWGTGGSSEWKEVRKDGYFLPKEQHHQVELTLRTNNTSYTPYVNKLLMAPAVKIEDIPSKSYKNMYIKTDIPTGADITDYETKLKTWWKIEG